jgi:hypothetical protein
MSICDYSEFGGDADHLKMALKVRAYKFFGTPSKTRPEVEDQAD